MVSRTETKVEIRVKYSPFAKSRGATHPHSSRIWLCLGARSRTNACALKFSENELANDRSLEPRFPGLSQRAVARTLPSKLKGLAALAKREWVISRSSGATDSKRLTACLPMKGLEK